VAEQQEATTEQEETAADSEAVQKKGSGEAAAPSAPNQKLVFLVLILNTVVLVALAAIFWVSNSKRQNEVSLGDIAASKEAPAAPEGHEEKGEKGKKEGGDEESDNFIKESFTVNLADAKGSHFAKVDVEIEVDDQFVKDEVNRLRPKIRDFIIVVLSSKTYDQIESVDGRDFLREEIRNKINGYLSRGKIKNVYFTQFIVQ
jgi:flagellar FliL protein